MVGWLEQLTRIEVNVTGSALAFHRSGRRRITQCLGQRSTFATRSGHEGAHVRIGQSPGE